MSDGTASTNCASSSAVTLVPVGLFGFATNMSFVFELIAARYERRSLLITANQPFGEWGRIFPHQAMTLAAIDRLVHHATILEMNVESYRRKVALDRKRGPGRPPVHTTPNELDKTLIDAGSAA